VYMRHDQYKLGYRATVLVLAGSNICWTNANHNKTQIPERTTRVIQPPSADVYNKQIRLRVH